VLPGEHRVQIGFMYRLQLPIAVFGLLTCLVDTDGSTAGTSYHNRAACQGYLDVRLVRVGINIESQADVPDDLSLHLDLKGHIRVVRDFEIGLTRDADLACIPDKSGR